MGQGRATVVALIATLLMAAPVAAQAADPAAFTLDDMGRLKDITEPVFTADGQSLIYVVAGKGDGDALQSDLWRVAWDGGEPQPLTRSGVASEWAPEPSADGRFIGYLSDAGDVTQLWVMPATGGAGRRVTNLPGGISEFTLSPDGLSAIVVAEVGSRVGQADDAATPIVIDRFQTREDGRDWLDDRRQHLFRVTLATGAAVQITHGDFDHWTPRWSPDGGRIAFVSKRCVEADRHICSDVYVMPAEGGEPTRVSTHEGGDADPEWGAGGPEWSPDSRRLVWVQAGDERLTWYTPFQLTVADLETGRIDHPAWIDRWFYSPQWSPDGRSILALVEQDRDTWLARIDPASGAIDYLTQGPRFAAGFAAEGDRIAVLDGDTQAPATLSALTPYRRALADANPWLAERRLVPTQDVAVEHDGVVIHSLLTLPPDYKPGDRPPLIVRLHGGPVYQFSHEFMADWQVYAAQGYAVLGVNPRGSSGRGQAFAQAQMANWGGPDVADVSTSITRVIEEGLVDPDRIGVGGWSYGGILTDYMIVSDPRIRAAVSGAGMGHFVGGYGVDQYARDYEIELGAPWDQPDLWRRLSRPFYEVRKVTAPTLFLCAEADSNVPCVGAQQMYQALRSTGTPTRLVVYPGENHGLVTPSHIRDRMQRQLDWYGRWLTPTTPTGDGS